MKDKGYYKNTLKNVMQVFNLLKKAEKDGELMTISKISKLSGLHKWTVSRTVDIYMSQYVDIVIPEGFEDIGLRIKFIRLKNPDMTEEQVLRFLKMRSLTF